MLDSRLHDIPQHGSPSHGGGGPSHGGGDDVSVLRCPLCGTLLLSALIDTPIHTSPPSSRPFPQDLTDAQRQMLMMTLNRGAPPPGRGWDALGGSADGDRALWALIGLNGVVYYAWATTEDGRFMRKNFMVSEEALAHGRSTHAAPCAAQRRPRRGHSCGRTPSCNGGTRRVVPCLWASRRQTTRTPTRARTASTQPAQRQIC